MKVFSVSQIREADAYTIKHEPVASIDLMERAARACYSWFHRNISRDHLISIFCGKGNNGGDGLALARMLKLTGFRVEVYIIDHSKNSTVDFNKNLERLQSLNVPIKSVKNMSDLNKTKSDVVVDSILGSGLNSPLQGFILEVIEFLNNVQAQKIAIDIPTGLFADDNSGNQKGSIFKADQTLSFQFPKFSFLFPEFGAFTGKLWVLDIGLSSEFIENTVTDNYFVDDAFVHDLLPSRNKFDYKGSFGHALIIAGSKGKIGAAILAAKASLKSGTGLVSAYVPECGLLPFQSAFPESMVMTDRGKSVIENIDIDIEPTAIGIGPGIGSKHETGQALFRFLENCTNPVVLDADALNLISKEDKWELLPKNSILTPHLGELRRMLKSKFKGDGYHETARLFAMERKVVLVVKGAHTAVYSPSGDVYFNSTGTHGMATAGSGDVLTGMITGLLAQGLEPLKAAILGVFFHGKAGESAAQQVGDSALSASDIIRNIRISADN